MNRAVEFRGKTIDRFNKNHISRWVYGYLIQTKPNKVDGEWSSYIMEELVFIPGLTMPSEKFIQVDPKTVGQFTGLKDKHGVKIFEEDIIKYSTASFYDEEKREFNRGCVEYINGAFCPVYRFEREIHDFDDKPLGVMDLEVIGNKFDNPDLLEEKHE